MVQTITCPGCEVAMVQEEHHGVALDRCTSCDGLWFDIGEVHEFLRSHPSLSASNTPDTFEFRIGTHGIGEVCPSCSQQTIEYGSLRGIGFRSCTWCGGFFLEKHQIHQILRSRPGEITCSETAVGPHRVITESRGQFQPADVLLAAVDCLDSGLLEGAAGVAEVAVEALFEFIAEAICGAIL